MIYANNAGTSWPKPSEVSQAVAATLAAPPEGAPRLLAAAHEEIAGFLGVRDPVRLLLMPGCTSALALAIGDLPWEPGDVVVTSSLEHHALARPVAKLVSERGVIHRAIPYRPGLPVDPGFISGLLDEGRVRLVALTAASNVTGEILPVEEIAGMAHRHGALCLVDAAQTVGLLPIDVEELGADILVFAGHKGPLGPQGIGGLWAAPHVEFRSPAAACEIGGTRRADGACSPFPGYCDAGSANVAGAEGLAAGMRWLASRGAEEMGLSQRQLAKDLVSALAGLRGATLLGSPDVPRTATLSMTLDRLPVERAEAWFHERGIVVRAGQHCAQMALEAVGAPGGTIRVSFGPFNTGEDVETIASAVREACATA